MNLQKVFEAWALTDDGNCTSEQLRKNKDGEYFLPEVERDWLVWQVAMGATAEDCAQIYEVESEQHTPDPEDYSHRACLDCAEEIRDHFGLAEETKPCWSCRQPYTETQRLDEDGKCPHCGVEIENEEDYE